MKPQTSRKRRESPVSVLRRSEGWVPVNLSEIWQYRDLLYFLVWRDLKVRYKQTILGAFWAILQPFLAMLIFSVFFGNLAGIPSDGIPYPIFAYTALVPWQYFSSALAQSGNSLVANQQLITKVYFPRLLIPLSAGLSGLVDFGISFTLLLAMLLYYRITPTAALLTLPFFLLLAIATTLAVGIWLSALNVEYRDVRYIIPFLTQFWLFATPIAYPTSLIPPAWRAWYGLNPMAGVVEGFRWALLGKEMGVGSTIIVSTIVVVIILMSGLVYFRRMEKNFADVI